MNEKIEHRFETGTEKKLAGQSLTMSLADNRTGELWKGFMPRRKEFRDVVDTSLYSLQVFDPTYFEHFNPAREFTRWAAVEVASFEELPVGMHPFVLPGGLYAVFLYKGASTDGRIFHYIFTDWLPRSGYVLDNRPHFELLGELYKNGSPDSEEELWIPVKPKA